MIILLLSIFTININKQFENIDKHFENIDKRFDSINEKLDYLTGKKSKDISTISSCFIIVKDKNDKEYYGSGNLVNINNNLFVATCLHNFYDNTTGMIYIPEIIQNKDRKLKFDKEKIIFDINSKYDLALIPITEEDNIKDKAAFISNRTSEAGEKLYGTNYYLGEYSFGECYVVSTNLGPSYLKTNCPGKRHYSGTGYFNTDGFLAAIHKSGLKYTNELSEDIFEDHNLYVSDRARNPRSILVDAKYLINLYQKRKILIRKYQKMLKKAGL